MYVSIMNACSVAQSCPTLETYSPPGSCVHGILQARIQEWVAISYSRGSSRPKGWTCVSCTADGFFTRWAIGEVQLLCNFLRNDFSFFIKCEILSVCRQCLFLWKIYLPLLNKRNPFPAGYIAYYSNTLPLPAFLSWPQTCWITDRQKCCLRPPGRQNQLASGFHFVFLSFFNHEVILRTKAMYSNGAKKVDICPPECAVQTEVHPWNAPLWIYLMLEMCLYIV